MRRALFAVLVLFLLPACASAQSRNNGAQGSTSALALTMGSCPSVDTVGGATGGLPDLFFPCLDGSSQLTVGGAPGRPTVLNLWAPWCGPCKDELPLFDRLYQQAGEAVTVVGLVEKDTLASSVAFAAESRLTFPSALDETGELSTALGLNGLPVTFFLRADGSIAHRQIGPITSYDELVGLVAEHLGVDVSA